MNSSEAILKNKGNLSFTYYHVFTQSDSEGVIPLLIDYNDMAGNKGETLEALDGTRLDLDDNCTIITCHNYAVALAGVLGGKETAVNELENIKMEN